MQDFKILSLSPHPSSEITRAASVGANIIYAKDHYFDVEGDFALWWEKQVKKAEDDGVALAVLKSHICAARTWQWKVWFNTIERRRLRTRH